MNKVEFVFLELDGKSEIMEFISSLPTDDKKKLIATIKKVEKYGISNSAKMKWVKKLDWNIYEIRSRFASNIQRCLYFHKVNNVYVITHGFTKKTDKTPRREMRHAVDLMKKYEENNND